MNEEVLAGVLAALARAEQAAMSAGVTLAQATAADVLAMRGVLETGAAEEDDHKMLWSTGPPIPPGHKMCG